MPKKRLSKNITGVDLFRLWIDEIGGTTHAAELLTIYSPDKKAISRQRLNYLYHKGKSIPTKLAFLIERATQDKKNPIRADALDPSHFEYINSLKEIGKSI